MKKIKIEQLKGKSFTSSNIDNHYFVKYKVDENGNRLPMIEYAYSLAEIIKKLEKEK